VACGNCSGRTVDKLRAFGLTPLPASQVGAPLVAECFANLEARVVDTRLVTRYGFFVLEVVQAWIDRRRSPPRPWGSPCRRASWRRPGCARWWRCDRRTVAAPRGGGPRPRRAP